MCLNCASCFDNLTVLIATAIGFESIILSQNVLPPLPSHNKNPKGKFSLQQISFAIYSTFVYIAIG
jgi:hypothetical protein